MTDVILDSARGEVRVECENLNVRGHDLLLSADARRRPDGPIFRRALVHDTNDGLAINFGGDYPGGVTISGLRLAEIVPLSRDPGDRPNTPGHLVVHGGISYEAPGLRINPGEPGHVTVSVGDQIEELHRKIDELAAKVAALGG